MNTYRTVTSAFDYTVIGKFLQGKHKTKWNYTFTLSDQIKNIIADADE